MRERFGPDAGVVGDTRDAAMTAWEQAHPEKMDRMWAAAAIESALRPERVQERRVEEERNT